MKKVVGWALGLMILGGGIASAELKVGDSAPDFNLPGTDGRTHRLSEMKGKTVVLAWFPKAFTSG
jgi:peroxiredoxin Q/BCP